MYSDSGNFVLTWAEVVGRFTLTAPATIELQHWALVTQSTNGLGPNIGITATVEVYAELTFVKEDQDVGVGGVWELVDFKSGSGAAELVADFTDDPFSEYEIVFDVAPDTDNTELFVQVSDDKEVTFEATDYWWALNVASSGGTEGADAAEADTQIDLFQLGTGSAAEEHATGSIWVTDPANTTRHKQIRWISTHKAVTSSRVMACQGGGQWQGNTTALTNLRIYAATGNISGNISIYRRSLRFPSVIPVGGAVQTVETISGGATVTELDFTKEIDANGDKYEFICNNLSVDVDDILAIRTSSDGGSTFDSGVSDYNWYGLTARLGAVGNQGDASDSEIQFTTALVEASANHHFTGSVYLYNPSASEYTTLMIQGNLQSSTGNDFYISIIGVRQEVGVVDAVRFFLVSGNNINGGSVTLLKYRNHERLGESNPALMSNRAATAKVWTNPDGSIRFYAADGTEVWRIDGPAPTGRKNAFINGDFDVWQRGTSFTATGYTADRWQGNEQVGTGGAATFSRQAFTIGQTDVPDEPKYYFRHDQTTGATNRPYTNQRIESVRTFAGQQITVSISLVGTAYPLRRPAGESRSGTRGGTPAPLKLPIPLTLLLISGLLFMRCFA